MPEGRGRPVWVVGYAAHPASPAGDGPAGSMASWNQLQTISQLIRLLVLASDRGRPGSWLASARPSGAHSSNCNRAVRRPRREDAYGHRPVRASHPAVEVDDCACADKAFTPASCPRKRFHRHAPQAHVARYRGIDRVHIAILINDIGRLHLRRRCARRRESQQRRNSPCRPTTKHASSLTHRLSVAGVNHLCRRNHEPSLRDAEPYCRGEVVCIPCPNVPLRPAPQIGSPARRSNTLDVDQRCR